MTSSLKPHGQSKPNFKWRLLGKGKRKYYINGPGHMDNTYYGKNLQKSYDLETWHAASGTQDLQSLYDDPG